MVINNWLLNNGKPMDAPMAFLCSGTPLLHQLSAARERGSILDIQSVQQGRKSTLVGTASPGYLPLTRL